jgi:hypothetical protein
MEFIAACSLLQIRRRLEMIDKRAHIMYIANTWYGAIERRFHYLFVDQGPMNTGERRIGFTSVYLFWMSITPSMI